jgi:hypothetical protein
MTKSKGVGRGGRRKGAGRPSRFNKTSYFSTRITPGTRALIEAEARRSGLSLSTTVERLLRFGLDEKEKLNREAPLRAICYLVGLLPDRIPSGWRFDPKYNWRTNPFMFKAFSVAVAYLLDALQPPGEVTPPPPPPPLPPLPPEAPRDRAEFFHAIRFPTFDTPENRGRDVARHLLVELNFPENYSISALHPDLAREAFGDEGADLLLRLHYGLTDAKRDLDFSLENKRDLDKRLSKAAKEDESE